MNIPTPTIKKRGVRVAIVAISAFLNKNTGFLIIAAIIVFGLMNLGFDKDNRTLINKSNSIATDTKTIIKNLETAVKDLKADNEKQTIVLCRFILRGDVDLTDDEAKTVEEICKDQIKRTSTGVTPTNNLNGASNGNMQNTTGTNQQNSSDQNNNSQNGNNNTNLLQPVTNLIEDTINNLNKGVQNAWWGLTHLERNK